MLCPFSQVIRVFIATFILLFCTQNTGAKPSILRLGSFFPIFKTTLEYDISGHNRFGGFYVAVHEINNKTDGIADHILPNTTIEYVLKDSKRDEGSAFFAAFESHQQAFNGLGVHAIVGAASSGPSTNVQLVCKEIQIPQVSYSSSAPILSDHQKYPYFLRTVASDVFQARVMVDVLLHNAFSWLNIATIAGPDIYSASGIEAFQTRAIDEGIEILVEKHIVPNGDISRLLSEIKKSGAKIVVMFSQVTEASEVLDKAYQMDMFGVDTGYVWVLSDTASGLTNLKNLYGADIMGTFYVAPSKPSGKEFREYKTRHAAFPSKLGSCPEKNVNASLCNCSAEMDDDGNFLWMRDHDLDASTPERCVGLDFPNEEVSTFNPYAYDAVYAIAHAAHALIEEQGVEEINGISLFESLLNTSLDGVTGLIKFGTEFNSIDHHQVSS